MNAILRRRGGSTPGLPAPVVPELDPYVAFTGTCADNPWRDKLIPFLEQLGVPSNRLFDVRIDGWTPEAEVAIKKTIFASKLIVHYLGSTHEAGDPLSVLSLFEAGAWPGQRGEDMLVILDDSWLDPHPKSVIEDVRRYLEEHTTVSLADSAGYALDWLVDRLPAELKLRESLASYALGLQRTVIDQALLLAHQNRYGPKGVDKILFDQETPTVDLWVRHIEQELTRNPGADHYWFFQPTKRSDRRGILSKTAAQRVHRHFMDLGWIYRGLGMWDSDEPAPVITLDRP